jgi:ribosomal-protein-serine acetyltransferase
MGGTLMASIILPDAILCERVVLTAQGVEHAEELFALIEGDRERLTKAQVFFETIQTLDDQVEDQRKMEAARDEGRAFAYAITVTGADGARQIIGSCGAYQVMQEHQKGELGYWIISAFESRGLVTESIQGLQAACFAAGFHRLEIRCAVNNPRSRAIPDRLGYQLEGRRRDAWVLDGERHDGLIFSRLRTDPPP